MMGKCILAGLFWFAFIQLNSQIFPPGLTKKGSASWFAIGVNQELNAKQSIQGYVGLGRVSNENPRNPFQEHSLQAVSGEFKHKIKNSWSVSTSLSYRLQQQPQIQEGFSNALDAKQEFRVALLGSKGWKLRRFSCSFGLKQELRLFYDKEFKPWDESIQWRTRLKFKGTFFIAKNQKHKIIASIEELMSISKTNNEKRHWNNYHYTDTRICAYYSYSPSAIPITFEIGYMADLAGIAAFTEVNYVCFDLIWKNPFGKMVSE